MERLRVVAADKAYPGGLAAHQAPVSDPDPVPLALEDLAERTLTTPRSEVADGPLRQELGELITDEEIEQLRPLLSERERQYTDGHGGLAQRTWLLALAVHHGIPGVAERAGLSPALPPDDVHAMYHETWAAGGDIVYSDMIDIALRRSGMELAAGQRVLDFGCSSARVVRMFAARRPEISWAGCDVNEGAIAWARQALPAIDFSVQPLRPPLPYDTASFDAVFAISIWSHYAAEPGLAWLQELHRVIKPGGALLITTHGPGAIAARAAHPDHGPTGQAGLIRDLYRHGFAFVPTYGTEGDHGVIDDGWGTAFMTPEWLLTQTTPKWSARLYRPAAVAGDQDLWVLRRED